jgi:beta-lactamase superfamily II metal-dependent hydrolase
MILRIFDVEHGQCALIELDNGKYFMIDVGHNGDTGWKPGPYLRQRRIGAIDMLGITNYDRDHVSGLIGLTENVDITVLMRNMSISLDQLREIKKKTGGIGYSIGHLIDIAENKYTGTASSPALECPGFSYQTFCHGYEQFQDTNNLSLVIYVELHGRGILFPGDLETGGWLKMLERDDFRAILPKVRVFVASHHGRDNGVCAEVFDRGGKKLCQPHFVVISDKSHEHETQKTHDFYHGVALGSNFGDPSATRYVLTTRSDGRLKFTFNPDAWYATNR